MHNHVILIGLGSVGLRVLETLVAEGQQVVVLDRDENNRYLGNARALDVSVIIADATTPGALMSANLLSARAVAVLTGRDLTNIETSLAVDESLGELRDQVPVVLRVFDRQLAQTIETSFGFRNVRSTSALAAPWFVGAAVIAISRARQNGRLEHPLRRDAVFEGGDQAYLIGPYEELLGVLRRDQHSAV
jgi:voltage-gated potassium channel Kch